MKFWRRKVARPDETIGKVIIRPDGVPCMIVAWRSDIGYTVEPLVQVLARTLVVEGADGPSTLGEQLLLAGWQPPPEVERPQSEMQMMMKEIHDWNVMVLQRAGWL